jgi:hypothetical protein
MDVLEALKAVEDDEIIRYEESDDVYFILQTTLHPVGKKEIIVINLDEIVRFKKTMPTGFHDVDYDELGEVCLKAIRSDRFRVVTQEEMFGEIQSAWETENA